ncbi:MAG: hypothetical protein ACR2OJ_13525, partial [Hyphomicrobiales bacterium]
FVMRGLRTSNFSNLKDILAAETKAKSKGARFEPSAKQLRALIPTLERLSLGEMMIVPDTPASANDAGVISLKNIDVSMDDHIGPIPTKMNIVVNGFSMPSTVVPDPKAQAGLQALAYKELAGDLKIDLNWDEATNTLNASEVSIDAKDAAKISIKASLNGIPRALFEDPEKNAMAATFASLANLDIKISNNSLIERALKIAASDLQQDPDNLKKLIVAQAGQFLAALGNEEFSTRALSELRAFLNDPVSLKLSAAPLNPVPILQLGILAQGSPGLLVQMLNVQVRANN